MFLLILRYTAPIEEVDTLHAPHVAWLNEQHAAGQFLAWGRQIPREGGVILADGDDRAAMEQLAASDPFVTGGVATVEVIEWTASFAADGLEALRP